MSNDGQDLISKMALSVEVEAQGEKIKFVRTDMKTTDMTFNTGPDWEFTTLVANMPHQAKVSTIW